MNFKILYSAPVRSRVNIRLEFLFAFSSFQIHIKNVIRPEECIEFSNIPAPPAPALEHPAGLQKVIISRFQRKYFVDFHNKLGFLHKSFILTKVEEEVSMQFIFYTIFHSASTLVYIIN